VASVSAAGLFLSGRSPSEAANPERSGNIVRSLRLNVELSALSKSRLTVGRMMNGRIEKPGHASSAMFLPALILNIKSVANVFSEVGGYRQSNGHERPGVLLGRRGRAGEKQSFLCLHPSVGVTWLDHKGLTSRG